MRIQRPSSRGGGGKHVIYVAAFGSHLFDDLFLQGWVVWPPSPWIRYCHQRRIWIQEFPIVMGAQTYRIWIMNQETFAQNGTVTQLCGRLSFSYFPVENLCNLTNYTIKILK